MQRNENLDTEAEAIAQLTNVQLLNILHTLTTQIRNLEDAVLALVKDSNLQDEFLVEQILKARGDLYVWSKKTPFARLEELESCLKGYIAYSQEKEAEREARRKPQLKAQAVKGIES